MNFALIVKIIILIIVNLIIADSSYRRLGFLSCRSTATHSNISSVALLFLFAWLEDTLHKSCNKLLLIQGFNRPHRQPIGEQQEVSTERHKIS